MTAPTDSKGSCAVNVIAVYGSSRITPADPEYADALEVGRLLGAAGYTIMTGGYAGVMEAASRGAAEAGARVIGVTTAAIEALAGRRANPWLTEEVAQDLFSQRIDYLVRRAQGFVAMPGGIGTLEEIFEVWTWAQLGIHAKPLGFYDVGGFYDQLAGFLDHATHQGFLKPVHRGMAAVETDPELLLSRLADYHGVVQPKWMTAEDM